MPIVNSREATGKLSPLEEEEVTDGGEGLEMMMMEKTRKSTEQHSSSSSNSGGVSVFTTLGTLILTARPYNISTYVPRWREGGGGGEGERGEEDGQGATLQGEIFETINKESLLVMQEHMEKLWCERIPMCIEVKGEATPSPNESSSLLLEQWLIQVLPRRSHPPPIPPSFLAHAVSSFLHFSQIRSWIVSHKGSLPFDLTYRVCAPGEDETLDQFSPHSPKLHTFPPSPLSPLSSLQVTVRHLPRLKTTPTTLTTPSTTAIHDERDIVSKFRDLSLSKSAERLKDLSVISNKRSSSSEHAQNNPALFSKSAECLKDLVSCSSGGSTVTGHCRNRLLSKSAERVRDLSTRSRVVIPPHLTREPPSPQALSPRSPPHTPSSSSHHHSLTPSPNHHSSHPHQNHTSLLLSDTFPFSPPQPSPMSPKLLAGLGEPLQYRSLLDRTTLNVTSHDNSSSVSNGKASFEISGCSSECSCQSLERGGSGRDRGGEHYCSGSFCFDSLCVREGGCEGWREGEGGRRGRGDRGKKVETVVKRGAVRSPAASSPVPFMRRTMSETKNQHKRSSATNFKGVQAQRPSRPRRSNSAPAIMHSLSLLGTFEESILNGRLEPCGFVEGFTAELGASGSFCPRHISLPVTAAFFNLSDCGTSPYLGVIDLSTTGKRGYHIAKKGTVQLTLFNPNGTVVKIFVVTYDHSDMPPNSQTFLRQKTVSPPLSRLTPHTLSSSPPLLHYLIHLRFLCSRSGRVYLHKDIRLIFARRAPDTEPDFSRVTLTTVTEAPPSPKYGPLDGQSSDRIKLAGVIRF